MVVDDLLIGNAISMDLAQNRVVVNVPAWDVEGVADRSKIDYYLDVYVPTAPGSSVFELMETLFSREKPVESVAGISVYAGAFFEIDKLLTGWLENSVANSAIEAEPRFEPVDIVAVNGLCMPYYCQYRIEVNEVNVSTVILASRWAINAGIGEEDYADYHADYILSVIGDGRRFLTNRPDRVPFYDGQPERLYWLHNFDFELENVRVKYGVTYVNGDVAYFEDLLTSNIGNMSVYCIPVASRASAAYGETSFTEDVAEFGVWLINENDDRLTEVRTFVVQDRFRKNSRHILFLNSFGVYDLMPVYGSGVESVVMAKVIGEQFRGYAYLAQTPGKVIQNKFGNKLLSVGLHWSSKTYLKYLLELVYSKSYYLVTEKAHVPLLLENDDYLFNDDLEHGIGGRVFDFVYANGGENTSDLPKKAVTEDAPTGWRVLSATCELDSRGRYNGKLRVVSLEKYYIGSGAAVNPRQVKPNTVNEVGYIAPAEVAACALANTPYRNVLIEGYSAFYRATCPNGEVGGPPLISIAAETWGSTISQADADQKAQAAWDALNTQAYADTNGSCDAIGNYTVDGGVPSGYWWIKFATWNASITNVTGVALAAETGGAFPGNMWFNQPGYQANQTDVYPVNTWNVPFPVHANNYKLHVYLTDNNNVVRTVKWFKNGILNHTETTSSWNKFFVFPENPADGDKWYVDIR
jgi:hypothetical protein